ncbi:limbic system-associated membrane protein-like [Centruroides vittatus]|uniref:limbic system-associated membrane protein-like n=1 Tax=Centruroides vittatus TaxID=120091 RepID=UPI003510BB9B
MLHNLSYMLLYLLLLVVSWIPLEAQDLPKIKPFSFNGRVKEGEKALTTCLVVSNSDHLTFSWLKNGVEITDTTADIRIKYGPDYSLVIIDPVQVNSEGNYTCIVNSKVGSSSYVAELLVEAAPTWNEEPKDENVIIGETLTLKCNAKGSPLPRITWKKIKKSSKDLTPIMTTNGTIIITNITEKDGGVYQCEASNNVEPNLIKQIHITVYGFSQQRNYKINSQLQTLCGALSSQDLSFYVVEACDYIHKVEFLLISYTFI